MSVNNMKDQASKPSIRQAADALLAALDDTIVKMREPVAVPFGTHQITMSFEDSVSAPIAALREALAAPVASRPQELPDIALALSTIELMKDARPIAVDGIKAVVETAELGVEQIEQFDVRWAADMRGIRRWQAGDALPTAARVLLTETAERLREAASDYASQDIGAAYHAYSELAGKVEEMLKDAEPGRRALAWPDHADLVVWLMEVIDCSVDRLDMINVERVRQRLSRAIVESGGNKLAVDSKKLIDELIVKLHDAERRAYMATHGGADIVMSDLPDIAALTEAFLKPELHISTAVAIEQMTRPAISGGIGAVAAAAIEAMTAWDDMLAAFEGVYASPSLMSLVQTPLTSDDFATYREPFDVLREAVDALDREPCADPGAAGQAVRPGARTRSSRAVDLAGRQPVPGVNETTFETLIRDGCDDRGVIAMSEHMHGHGHIEDQG